MDAEKRFLIEFIDCYKASQSLWDPSVPEYTSRPTKMIANNKLLNIMKKYKTDASINDVKKKVNTLRSNYRREVKRIRDSYERRENPVYTPILWWFERFDFLRNLKSLKQKNNCNAKQNEFVEGEMEMEDDVAEEEEPVYNMNLKIKDEEFTRPVEETYFQSEDNVRPKRHAEETYIQPEDVVRPPKRPVEETYIQPEDIRRLKRLVEQETYIEPEDAVRPKRHVEETKRVNRQDDNLQTNYRSSLPTPNHTFTPTPPAVGDTVDHMCKAWALDLREMDKHQRIIAGRAISEIIFQGQLGVLTIDSIPKMPVNSTQFGSLNNTQVTEEFEYTQSQIQSEDSSPKPPTAKFYSTPKIIHGRSISIEEQRVIHQSFSSVPEEEYSYDQ